ncbi:MAG TPA: alpha/beta hydrolase [Candidatus Acidoferrales bacterium]|nr:alpha/beta hydrolase [Candidatus Acidoferrales bacterium]
MIDAIAYEPERAYDVRVYDVTYREDGDGRWLARIYRPEGAGPFPALLDVHGGAWNRGSYTSNESIDRALAATGIVVAASALRRAPKYPYPSQVADVNYGARWLKARAQDFNADGRRLGGLGSSSGGHTIMLSAMRPRDARYSALPLAGGESLDATFAYIVAAWPVLDCYARYLYAKETGRAQLVESTEAYFGNEEAMKEGNPQLILERGEPVELPPVLILQGTNDDNVPLSIPHRFAESYRAAGGSVQLELFPGMPHGFARDPGPETERALALTKAFIARQLGGKR